MLTSFLKRDLKDLIQRDASPNSQAQNGLLSVRFWWRSVRSVVSLEPDFFAILDHDRPVLAGLTHQISRGFGPVHLTGSRSSTPQ